jgi:ABC-type antimicrobial peptide transport system permease subunit
MNKLFSKKTFKIGFFVGILVFIAINFFDFNTRYSEWCSNCDSGFGFPFRLHEPGGLVSGWGVLFYGLVADILIATIFSFIIGLIFKFVWEKVAAKRLR